MYLNKLCFFVQAIVNEAPKGMLQVQKHSKLLEVCALYSRVYAQFCIAHVQCKQVVIAWPKLVECMWSCH
jgi:hypothetical protein